jgi:hypothetical protein
VTRFPLAWPEGWRRFKENQRKSAQFKHYGQRITVAEATTRLMREMDKLGVRDGDAVLSTNLKLRLDGLPRSDQAMPDDPGVAIYWKREGETMRVMAIDRYDRVEYNIAALAATMEAMRAIERHGGAVILDRAFTGFEALPAPGGSQSWRDVLEIGADEKLDFLILTRQFQLLRSKSHPDKGGSSEWFVRVERAYHEGRKALGA